MHETVRESVHDGRADEFGIYVHVPFCRHRCDYCAFATYTDRDHLMKEYIEACCVEVRRAREEETLPLATSIFVGGGTPSRLPAELLGSILTELPRQSDAEITVECNPEDITEELLAAYRRMGVTRISMGVQSTRPHVLRSLGRRHRSSDVRACAALVAGAGFQSWNADLIFGAVGESDQDWSRCLEDVLTWPAPPPHLSAYALTVEPGTPLARSPNRHPDDESQARRYALADRVLLAAGYRWEEISNWALPGHGCRHNQLYWRQGDYRGIGAAAHSHRAGHRWWNIRTPDRYVAAVQSGRLPMAGEESLAPQQQAFEALVLALRTPRGVPASCLPDRWSSPGLEDLFTIQDETATLTVRGRLLANEVTARLELPGGVPVSSLR